MRATRGPSAFALGRRLQLFRARTERFAWRVVATLAVLSASLLAFAELAEDTTTNDTIVDWDTRFNRWLNHESTAPLVSAFKLVTLGGSTICLTLVALVASTVLLVRGRRADALLVALAYAGAEVLTFVLKNTFERERPPFHDPGLSFSTFSFPSGHSTVSAAVYGALAIVVVRVTPNVAARIAVVLGATTLVLAVGFSRIYLGAHYLSDVLAGLSLGTAWLATCVLALTLREAHRQRTQH